MDADEQEEVTQYFSLYTSGSVDVFIQMCHLSSEETQLKACLQH